MDSAASPAMVIRFSPVSFLFWRLAYFMFAGAGLVFTDAELMFKGFEYKFNALEHKILCSWRISKKNKLFFCVSLVFFVILSPIRDEVRRTREGICQVATGGGAGS